MFDFDDTSIMISEKEIHYSDTDIFSHKMGFNVGFAITRFDGNRESIENEDIGVMKAYYKKYGPDYEGIGLVEIPTRNCNK